MLQCAHANGAGSIGDADTLESLVDLYDEQRAVQVADGQVANTIEPDEADHSDVEEGAVNELVIGVCLVTVDHDSRLNWKTWRCYK